MGRDLRQQGAKVWDGQRCAGGSIGSDPLAHPDHPLLTMALHGQGPSMQARSPGRQEWKSMLGCKRHSSLCLLIYGRHVPAKLRDVGGHTPRMRQSKMMRQLLRQRQGLVDVCQGLRRVPQEPEGQRGPHSAACTWILAHAKHRSMALVWRVECDGFL